MAQSKTIKSDEFDSLVIGSGLAGLIAAHQLEGTGRKVALIEGLETLGGSSRAASTPAGLLEHTLKFFPDVEGAQDDLRWLSEVLGEEITYTVVEAPPVNYDDGKFKPFVGFGDQKVETAAEIDAYAQARYLRLDSTPRMWVPKLIDSFTGTVLTQSFATKMQVDDQFVIEVIVNGSKRLSGREVFFCAAPQQLSRLLPEANFQSKLRQKLMKGDLWTSVNLELIHSGKVTDSEAMHVLKGANEEPSVGLFRAPQILEDGREAQVSQWVTLVPRDITDEAELVASALKQIKRQVKRAYEHSLNDMIRERIVVSPSSHGDFSGIIPESGAWPKLENLWVVSGLLNPAKNALGTIRQARNVLTAVLGEGPIQVMEPTDLDEHPQPTA